MRLSMGTRIEGGEARSIQLFDEVKLSTIEAVENSGFEVREIFGDYMSYNWDTLYVGVDDFFNAPGPEQVEIPLNEAIITEVYHHAIAWALSLIQSFPEQVKSASFDEAGLEDHLVKEAIDSKKIEELKALKIRNHHRLEEHEVRRAVDMIHRPLYYCSEMLKYLQEGKELYIWYE